MKSSLALWVGLEVLTVLLVGLVVYSNAIWQFRRQAIILPMATSVIAMSVLVSHDYVWMSIPVVILHVYYFINLLRVYHSLSIVQRLRHILFGEQLWLTSLSVSLATAWWLVAQSGTVYVWRILALGSLLLALGGAAMLVTNKMRSNKRAVIKVPTEELPTVSLLIAARNEHHAITRTLSRALASDYPKLEIIVLDDCSHDATDAAIKSFARDGVRFVPGEVPKAGWQARNQAFDTLLEEASGEYVIFTGVDVHVSPNSIRHLVYLAVRRELDMLSLMPERRHINFWSSLLLVPRNFWLLVWPRGISNPPAISSFWMMKRSSLQKAGGFAAVRASVNPEQYFARWSAAHGKYQFLAGTGSYGVTTRKRLNSQIDTEVRNLYPMLRRSVTRSAAASIGYLSFIMLPTIAVWLPVDAVARTTWALAIAVAVICHMAVYIMTIPKLWYLGLINFPLVFAIEFWLLQLSMYRYEFGEVLWKGRNVCEPIKLRTFARLPDLDVPAQKSKSAL